MGGRSDTRIDPRRGLFLALESLAGTAALLLDEAGAAEYGNAKALALLGSKDADALRARWADVAPLFSLALQRPFVPTPRFYTADAPHFAGSRRRLTLELHALDEDVGGGYLALLKDSDMLDALERELVFASERRGWIHLRESLVHDLKGILNSMQISLELIGDPDPQAPRNTAEQERRSRRLASLKDGLTRMDRALRQLPGAEGNAEPPVSDFDANDLVKDVLAGLRQLVRRNNVELKLDLQETPIQVTGRRPWIKQALFNVTVHRLNAMRAGGSLGVEVITADHAVVIKLHDNVVALPGNVVEGQERPVFAGRSQHITGMQVARAIIEAHGGSLEVDSDTTGTEVLLRLPS